MDDGALDEFHMGRGACGRMLWYVIWRGGNCRNGGLYGAGVVLRFRMSFNNILVRVLSIARVFSAVYVAGRGARKTSSRISLARPCMK
jgi:hypothetical protein